MKWRECPVPIESTVRMVYVAPEVVIRLLFDSISYRVEVHKTLLLADTPNFRLPFFHVPFNKVQNKQNEIKYLFGFLKRL